MRSRMGEYRSEDERVLPAWFGLGFVVQPHHLFNRTSQQWNQLGPAGHLNKKLIQSSDEFTEQFIVRQPGLNQLSR